MHVVLLMQLSVWHNSLDDVHSKQGRWRGHGFTAISSDAV